MKDKLPFINETKEFFERFKLPYEYRNNFNGVCKFIPVDSESILYFNTRLNISVNVRFENSKIVFEIENYNSWKTAINYNLLQLKSKLFMILDYIDTTKKTSKILETFENSNINVKYKTHSIIDELSINFIGEMEDCVDDEDDE